MEKRLVMLALLLGALMSGAAAQGNQPQGFRVWVGPSLGNRDYELGKQAFSALGVAKDIKRDGAVQVYLDAFHIVERPVEVLPRVINEDVVGLGLARVFHLTDKAGVGSFYGFGLGLYRDQRTDSFPQTPKTTNNTLGMKLLAGTSIDGQFFVQAQLTYLSGRNDFQLGVGRKF
ncbi:hypothetical protein [Armatimonas sp.]|uniref:hypothetical protein n=1 Tax=Armatimonas sp. TaxID=1872638 RepID=UPI0037523106